MSNKNADVDYPIHDLIAKRWSPRSFNNKSVNATQVMKLIEAARWAPSSFNEQPWRFIIGYRGDSNYIKILESLSESNQKWAKSAPVLILTLGKKTFTLNNKDNKHYAYDTGQAVASLALQATADGFYLHQMAGFNAEVAKDQFSVPDDFQPLTAIALGYLGDHEALEEPNRKSEMAERKRKPLTELVFQPEPEE